MPDSADPAAARQPVTPALRVALTVLWSAFLAASGATLLLFAFIDPAPVAALWRSDGGAPERTALYSLAFLFCWSCSALAAGLTAWLTRPHPP